MRGGTRFPLGNRPASFRVSNLKKPVVNLDYYLLMIILAERLINSFDWTFYKILANSTDVFPVS